MIETQVNRGVGEDGESAPLPYAALIEARERVRIVLEPYLGPAYALERANNITQALVFDDSEPAWVAREMLRHMPSDQRLVVADAVGRAFRAGAMTARS